MGNCLRVSLRYILKGDFMENTELKKIVQESTSKYGFMYCKKNYYCDLDDTIVIINLQKSNFDNSFYINPRLFTAMP